MKRIVLTFGLIAGVIMSAMMVILLPFHEQLATGNAMILGYATMVAAFLLIFFGVRSYRDNLGGGAISFGKAAQVGALIAVIASACYVATWEVIYFGGMAPNYMEKYQEKIVQEERAKGTSQEEIDKQVAEMKVWAERYKNPAINAAITFMEPLPVAIVMVLLTAAVLRRRSPAPA